MSLIRTSLLLCSILCLNACAFLSDYHSNQQNKPLWKDWKNQTVFQRLGRPDQILSLPNGHTLYVYMTQPRNTFVTPSSPTQVIVTPHGKAIGIPAPLQPPIPDSNDMDCSIVLEANQQGMIINSEVSGTNCEALVNLAAMHDGTAIHSISFSKIH
jgi:hypothetical protein